MIRKTQITSFRLDNNSISCRGVIYIDSELFGITMEDPIRDKKIPAITGIPAGSYKIKYQEEPTKLTVKYRNLYDWFNNHLMLVDVPGYQSVYIHIGNYPRNTDGCILINNILTASDPSMCGQSTDAFRKFYLKVSAAINRGDDVEIEIRNSFARIGQEIIKSQ